MNITVDKLKYPGYNKNHEMIEGGEEKWHKFLKIQQSENF